jgi:hypothetical protein
LLLVVLLLVLCVSIAFHIYYLFRYIRLRTESYQRKFINTAAINIVAAGISTIIAIFRPEEVQKIKGPLLIWFISGAIMIMTVALQVSIFIRVYRRTKLPENYHYNFFGKKVLHSSVAMPMEIVLFFSSIPMLLVSGAYFVARLIRFFL